MKSLNSFLFKLYILFLAVFIWSSMDFWYSAMNNDDPASSQSLLLNYSIFILVCHSFFVLLLNYKFIRIRGIHLICTLWCLIMPVIMMLNRAPLSFYFMTILWPVLFETSYLFVRQNHHKMYSLKWLFVIVSIWGVILFLQAPKHDEGQTNTIYFSLLTLPWILFLQKFKTQGLFLFIFSILIILSLKRSALLVLVICWLFYGLLILNKMHKKVMAIGLVCILLLVGGISYSIADNELGGVLSERVNREETDDGKNRLAIYEVTSIMILTSPIESLITGHGHYGVAQNSPLEISAHNDMLEVIYDYGLIIFFLYMCLLLFVVRRCIILYNMESDLFYPYLTSVIIFVIMSTVGHLILYTSYFNFIVIFWGCVDGMVFSKK